MEAPPRIPRASAGGAFRVNSASKRHDFGLDAGYLGARAVPYEKCSCCGEPRESSAVTLSMMETGCCHMPEMPEMPELPHG